eukprot:TRINITY_DN16377_c0_g1_i1.p1 TRINITY_DN16377_c0_g1~~TRINITY_DN16377_c0_g1_i1.p1  ORF type:complete len:378 (+),score=104.89 TRINITY_DN16377_c0_g1_i1:121-1254(+)
MPPANTELLVKATKVGAAWSKKSVEEQHEVAGDEELCREVLKVAKEANSTMLRARPQVVMKGWADLDPPSELRASIVSDVYIKHCFQKSIDKFLPSAVEALQEGVLHMLCSRIEAAHYSAVHRWGIDTDAPSNWGEWNVEAKGLSLLLQCAEQWCEGSVTPGLKKIALIGHRATRKRAREEQTPAAQGMDSMLPPSKRMKKDEKDNLPCSPDHLRRFLDNQLKAVTWRTHVLNELLDDTGGELPACLDEVSVPDRCGLDHLHSYADSLVLPRSNPLWTYVYAAYFDIVAAAKEAEMLRERAAAKEAHLRSAKEAEQRRALEEKQRTSRKALGVQRGVIIRRVMEITEGDVLRGFPLSTLCYYVVVVLAGNVHHRAGP